MKKIGRLILKVSFDNGEKFETVYVSRYKYEDCPEEEKRVYTFGEFEKALKEFRHDLWEFEFFSTYRTLFKKKIVLNERYGFDRHVGEENTPIIFKVVYDTKYPPSMKTVIEDLDHTNFLEYLHDNGLKCINIQ